MTIGKYKQTLRIDAQPVNPFAVAGADGGSGGGVDLAAPPIPPTVPAPTLQSLTPSLLQSAVTPSAKIAAVWKGLETYDSESYRVQVATDSGFTTDVQTFATGQNQSDAILAPLKVSTTYYVRVQTIVGNTESAWSNVLSTATPADTTAPVAPPSLSASFINAGDLLISWVNSTSANLRDTEVAIYSDNTKTTQLGLFYIAAQSLLWTAAQNLAATSQLGDPTVFVEIRARSWNTVFSPAVNTSASKTLPATPAGLTTSWAGDTGVAGGDCIISWTAATDAAKYVVTIDGVSRTVTSARLVYTYDQNASEHSGTADPVLSITVAAYDGLNQANASSATTTATNAAPAAPTITLLGGQQLAVATVTSTPAADFAAYEYVWKRDGTTVRTLESAAAEQQYEMSAAADSGLHAWTVVVRQKDLFGQYSSTTTSSAVNVDTLTTDALRTGLSYTDSDGNSAATLAVLKDGVTTSGGITYAA